MLLAVLNFRSHSDYSGWAGQFEFTRAERERHIYFLGDLGDTFACFAVKSF